MPDEDLEQEVQRAVHASAGRWPRWLTRARGGSLLPLEWLGLLALLLLTLSLAWLPVRYNLPLVFRTSFWMTLVPFAQIAGLYLIWRTTLLLVRGHRGSRWAEFRSGLRAEPAFRFSYWGDYARMIVAVSVVMSAHFLVKISIHIINPQVFDAWLWRYDRWLGFGVDPLLVLLELVRQPWLLHALDVTYSVVYPFTVLIYPPLLGLASPTRSLRVAALSGFCLLWIVGGTLYVAFPSWGPVYTQPAHFEQTLQSMPITVHVQQELLQELKGVIDNPAGRRPVKFGGVAAFPSLHLAVLTLFLLASRRVNRYWGWATGVLLGLMAVGSMVTGYHYLLDSLAGVVLGAACYLGAVRWVEQNLRVTGPRSETTAPPETA